MRRPGIWVANGRPTDVNLMYSWKPGSVTCFMDYLGPNRIREYKAENPDCPVIIRFQHPTNWMDDVAVSARNHADYVLSKWPEIMDIDPYIYFANETNLWYESGGNSAGDQWMFETPEFYSKFADWTGQVADRIKAVHPEIRLVTPPFAFGHHEDGAPDDNGDPKDGWAGYDYLADTIRSHFENIITFHGYWGDAGGYIPSRLYDPEEASWYAFRWRRVLKLFEHRYNIQVRVIIDECGNMDASVPDFTDQCIYYAEECLQDSRVLALTYFLWEDPTESPGNIVNSWVQRCADLDGHVSRLAEMPPVGVESGLTIRVLMPDGTVLVLPLEEYLRGVVPAEMPALWPKEALKAQAVAARTYAMVAMKDPRHGPDADICTTTHCEVYNPARIHDRSDEAVRVTSGQVITYQDQLANAYYSANCGGQTLGNEIGFGGAPLPHLRPVSCINSGPKNGHGVGMCQWGAHDMAEAGDDYVTILKHYYTDVQLSNEGDIPPPEPPPGGGEMIDPRLDAYTEQDGKVVGVKMEIMDTQTFISKWNDFKLKPGDAYFKLVHAQFLDENEAQGNTGIHISVQDENGGLMPAQVWYAYPTTRMSAPSWVGAFDNGDQGAGDVFSYPSGQGEIAQGSGNFAPDSPDDIGPYLVAVYTDPGSGSIASECAYGFGLPHNHHVAYALTFRIERWQQGTPEPTPPDPIPPDPVPPVPILPVQGGACTGSYAILSASILFSLDKLTVKQYMEIMRLVIGEA